MKQTKDLGVKLPTPNRVDEQLLKAMIYATVVFAFVCVTFIMFAGWYFQS